MTTDTLVSFVVPVFNEPINRLKLSLESIVHQTHQHWECIVVDESSSELTTNFCKEFCGTDSRFKYLHPITRVGLAASLNLGMSHASGEWVARFDSDDICLPDRLALQLEYLKRHKNIDVLGGAIQIIDNFGNQIATRHYPQEHQTIAKLLQFSGALAHPTVIFRKATILEAGAYSPLFRYSEDIELWLRLLNRGVRFANLPNVLINYRQVNAIRQAEHWKFNLQARLKNFTSNFFIYRVIGIVGIWIWSLLPKAVQNKIFQFIFFGKSVMINNKNKI